MNFIMFCNQIQWNPQTSKFYHFIQSFIRSRTLKINLNIFYFFICNIQMFPVIQNRISIVYYRKYSAINYKVMRDRNLDMMLCLT